MNLLMKVTKNTREIFNAPCPLTIEETALRKTPLFSTISRFSFTALGFPGKLRTSLFCKTPHSALERHAKGVIFKDSIRM